MTTHLTVTVTADDIAEGTQAALARLRRDEACPLTIAIRRTHPGAIVWKGWWRLARRTKETALLPASVALPDDARQFVEAFDAYAATIDPATGQASGRPPKPATFALPVPS